MLNKLLPALLLALMAGIASAQVYMWKDSKGVTQYADQPPPNVDAKTVIGGPKASPAPATDASAAAAASSASAPKSWQEKELEQRQRNAARSDAADKAQKEAAAKAERDAYCKTLRDNLSMFEAGGRITRPNAKGERDFLSDAQIAQEAERLRGQLARDCK